jgi:hypothetical protein
MKKQDEINPNGLPKFFACGFQEPTGLKFVILTFNSIIHCYFPDLIGAPDLRSERAAGQHRGYDIPPLLTSSLLS